MNFGAPPSGEASATAADPPGGLDGLPVDESSLAEVDTPELLPHREPWRSMLHGIGVLERTIGSALIVVILVLVLIQVAQRYLPGSGWPWTGEVARLALVWCTFVLSGYLMAHDRHISIQVVDLLLPPRGLAVVQLLGHVVVGLTCLAMAYACYQLIADDIGQVTPAAEIPLAWIYTMPLVGFALTALRAVLAIGMLDIPAIAGRSGRGAVSIGLLLVLVIGLFLLRVPMAFAIMGPCLLYLVLEDYSLGLAVRLVIDGIDSWPLLAVPLFILVGITATRTQIAAMLYDAVQLLLGPLRAGLAYVNIGVSLGFSWMSGAALADAAGLGSIEVDHMRKKGYPAEFSVGLSASSALISPIMPPSIPAVVYASVAAVSTGALFAAAVIPAVLMTLALAVTVYVWARGKPHLEGEPFDWPAARKAFVRALPPMGAPVIILGGILGGYFTPTEAAGIGALYMLLLALAYRSMSARDVVHIFRDTGDRERPDHDRSSARRPCSAGSWRVSRSPRWWRKPCRR